MRNKRSAVNSHLGALMGLLLSSAAAADGYPVNGVWVAPNADFPIGADEACFTVRQSGIDAVARKSLAQILIFNENKRYEVRRNVQSISTLSSVKLRTDGYWVTELPDFGRRFWFRQKNTYLLTIVDPKTIEIRSSVHRTKFVKCGSGSRTST
jgi:hypothetical protein